MLVRFRDRENQEDNDRGGVVSRTIGHRQKMAETGSSVALSGAINVLLRTKQMLGKVVKLTQVIL